MAPILYYSDISPAVRAVLLTKDALNMELELKEVNLMEKEHLTEDFIKMNPQHTIPTLDDDGFYLWDSHAICGYLVNNYAEDDILYPKNPTQRATVDQRLHFDSGFLSIAGGNVIKPILWSNETSISEENLSKVLEAYGYLENFLEHHEWVAGDNVTIADFCIVASVSSINCIIPVDADEFPKLAAWLERCAELPYYHEANAIGLEKLASLIKMKMEA